MANGQPHPLLRHIRRVIGLPEDGGGTDGQLLEAFVSQRDQAAFAALLGRHGAMVFRTCRRILHDPHDAEDALQATYSAQERAAVLIAAHLDLKPDR